jgi:hypothetical protein
MLEVTFASDWRADGELDGLSFAPVRAFGEASEHAETTDMRRTAAPTAAQVRRDCMKLLDEVRPMDFP